MYSPFSSIVIDSIFVCALAWCRALVEILKYTTLKLLPGLRRMLWLYDELHREVVMLRLYCGRGHVVFLLRCVFDEYSGDLEVRTPLLGSIEGIVS